MSGDKYIRDDSTSGWRESHYIMSKLLKQLDAYVKVSDWDNADHIRNLLEFQIKYALPLERERRKKR